MEAREILIANTKTQKNYKITTDAATLGELKAALRENNIDYEGMTFTEGVTKTQFLDDKSPIPGTVEFRGEQKSPVFLLTNTKKNIASGCEMSRKEVYALIKENHIEEDIKEYFKDNYTRIATDDLYNFILENHDILEDDEEEPTKEEAQEDKAEAVISEFLYDYVKTLAKNKIADATAIKFASTIFSDLGDMLQELAGRLEEGDVAEEPRHCAEVTDAETNEMIDDILAGM